MKMVCPSCGAVHSAEAWQNDADARQCLRIIGELPHDVSRRALPYLALFRPLSGRGLAWSKALRVLSELQEHVSRSYVQWENKVARPNSAQAWGEAMERVIARPPKKLPLSSHGYLRSIAYDIADEKDKQAEYNSKPTARTEPVKRHMDMPERLSMPDFAIGKRKDCL